MKQPLDFPPPPGVHEWNGGILRPLSRVPVFGAVSRLPKRGGRRRDKGNAKRGGDNGIGDDDSRYSTYRIGQRDNRDGRAACSHAHARPCGADSGGY